MAKEKEIETPQRSDVIIPPELMGTDAYPAMPDYQRKDGARFTLDENLSVKDAKYLIEQGVKLAIRGEAAAPVKKSKAESKKAQEADVQSADEDK